MILSPETPVGQIATAHPLATKVFARHGIDFCCGGGIPLAEACAEKSTDTARVIEELTREIEASPAGETNWNEAPIADLIEHILTTYHAPLKEELPRIAEMMEKVHRVHGDKNIAMFDELKGLVERVKTDMENHLPKEEQVLFPAILNKKRHMLSGPISIMEEEHEELGGMLRRIRELTDDYVAPDVACNTWRALWAALEQLELETHEHIHLENNILHKRAFNG
ncbi:UNVERIFIED_CONTAM: hypothetical protein GTU68_024764 [Idotea baltica]|nr:hypothetical protein [Idotea baltica]